MKKPFYIEHLITPVSNKVLVEVKDTYNQRRRESGMILSNAAHEDAHADSPGFTQSEFVIRSGRIAVMPRKITPTYDWYPEDELSVGDVVYWPIVNFHDYDVYKIIDTDRTFLMVPYFDIHAKVINGKVKPVNGYYLFTKIIDEVPMFNDVVKVESNWFKLIRKSIPIKYKDQNFNWKDEFLNIGDECRLSVPPFKLEADTAETFEKDYYLAQKRHIRIYTS